MQQSVKQGQSTVLCLTRVYVFHSIFGWFVVLMLSVIKHDTIVSYWLAMGLISHLLNQKVMTTITTAAIAAAITNTRTPPTIDPTAAMTSIRAIILL